MENPILKASLSHYIAQRDKILSELDICLNKPSYVGNSVSVTDRVIKLFKDLSENNNVIDIIKETILGNENSNINGLEIIKAVELIEKQLNEEKTKKNGDNNND